MKRATIFGFAALVGVLLVPPAFAATASAQDNTAVAVNTEDGSSVFQFAFSIKKVANDVVDPTNAAVAYASCEGCETVAVAIQVVLVSGDPSVVAPQNVAVAVNDDCDVCTTLAYAYQFVFGSGDEPVHFTKEGKEKLHAVKKAFKELQKQDLPLEVVLPAVNALAQQVNDVVMNEIVVGPPGQAKKDDASATADAAPSSTTSTSTTALTSTTAAPATTTTTAGALAGSTTTSPTTAPSSTTSTTAAP